MEINLCNCKVDVERPKLKEWVELQSIYNEITEALDDTEKLSDLICLFVSKISTIELEKIEKCFWLDVASVFIDAILLCSPKNKFPLLRPNNDKKQDEDWDYRGRDWYSWVHTLSKNFGWSIEYISELDVDDAIGLLQEILVDDQLAKEWQWGLSEIAYPYDSATKKSRFSPLKRPNWMKPDASKLMSTIEKIKIPKSMLPVGKVVSYS